MSYAASKNEILAARDRRHLLLLESLAAPSPSTLFLSMNIPGEDKSPPGTELLFSWGMERLLAAFPDLRPLRREADRLGPFALFSSRVPPPEAKRKTVALENAAPAARLLDIDVYDLRGEQVGRRELGLPPRRCLLCREAAADCIRLLRHDSGLLKTRTDELLRSFHP